MTVTELIEKLKELPQHMEVQFRVVGWIYEGVKEIEIYDIDCVKNEELFLALAALRDDSYCMCNGLLMERNGLNLMV